MIANSKTFLEIVNRILYDTDGEKVDTLEGDVLESTKTVCEWVNEGYDYCWKKMFQATIFKQEGFFPITHSELCACGVNKKFVEINSNYMTQFDNLLLDGKTELKYVLPEEFNRKDYDKNGNPEIYTIVGDKIRIKPVPNEPHFLKYYGTALFIPLKHDDDVPFINPNLLIAYGIFKQYCLDYNRIDGDSWYAFEELLKAEITSLTTPAVTQNAPMQMKVEMWG